MADILNGATTSEAVIAILGLADVELSATVITDAELDSELELEFLDWLPVAYTTIISEGTDVAPTAEQTKKYLLLRKYSKNFIAYKVVAQGILGLAEELTDGQNSFSRSEEALEKAASAALEAASAAKKDLLAMFDTTFSNTVTLLSGVRNVYDPVTNETES